MYIDPDTQAKLHRWILLVGKYTARQARINGDTGPNSVAAKIALATEDLTQVLEQKKLSQWV